MTLELTKGLCVGFLLGLGYFIGLWWTVRQLPGSKSPVRLLLGSFICRTIIFGGLLVLAAGHQVLAYVGAAAGFYIARLLMSNICRPQGAPSFRRESRKNFDEIRRLEAEE